MTPVLIVLIVFGFVTFIVKMGLEHERLKNSAPDKSLTTSELRRLIADAVEDSTTDLAKRLDRLERFLPEGDTPPRLGPHEEAGDDSEFLPPSWRE